LVHQKYGKKYFNPYLIGITVPRWSENPKVIKSISIPVKLCIRAEEEAERLGKTFSGMVVEAVMVYIALMQSEEGRRMVKDIVKRELGRYAFSLAKAVVEEEVVSGG